jgi:hypothetical protein
VRGICKNKQLLEGDALFEKSVCDQSRDCFQLLRGQRLMLVGCVEGAEGRRIRVAVERGGFVIKEFWLEF